MYYSITTKKTYARFLFILLYIFARSNLLMLLVVGNLACEYYRKSHLLFKNQVAFSVCYSIELIVKLDTYIIYIVTIKNTNKIYKKI